MAASAHPSTVSFNGSALGELLSVSVSPGSASPVDVGMAGLGGPADAPHVIQAIDVTLVQAGTVTVTFFSTGSGVAVGSRGSLSVSLGGGGGFGGMAYCTGYEVEASVGEFVRGSATFALMSGGGG